MESKLLYVMNVRKIAKSYKEFEKRTGKYFEKILKFHEKFFETINKL